MAPLSPIIAQERDRWNRVVVLREKTWRSIERKHPQLDGHELAVMRAVETADIRCRGNFPGAEELYATGLVVARWLVVVVAYEGVSGRVITAYPYRKEDPPELDRL